MADLRIVDAPVLLQESITDDVKMPTGGLGNFSIRLGDIVWYVVTKEQLANKNYVDTSSKSVKDSLDEHIADKANPHQVTKEQVGLGNVDNTADIDKPVSDAVSSAIITATTDMATKTYVNSKDGDLTTLTTTDKTNLVKAINEVVSVKADKDDVASSISNLTNNKADKATTLNGYGITDTYTKSEIDTNFNGLNSVTDMLAIVNPVNGQRVYVKSYRVGLNKGGGEFIYDSTKVTINNGGTVINGWVRRKTNIYLTPCMFGAYADGITDDTQYIQKAMNVAVIEHKELHFEGYKYVVRKENVCSYLSPILEIKGGLSLIGNNATIRINQDGVTTTNPITMTLFKPSRPVEDATNYGKSLGKIKISGFRLDGGFDYDKYTDHTTASDPKKCFLFYGFETLFDELLIEDNTITRFAQQNMVALGSSSAFAQWGIPHRTRIENNYFYDNGLLADMSIMYLMSTDVTVANNKFEQPKGREHYCECAIELHANRSNVIDNTYINIKAWVNLAVGDYNTEVGSYVVSGNRGEAIACVARIWSGEVNEEPNLSEIVVANNTVEFIDSDNVNMENIIRGVVTTGAFNHSLRNLVVSDNTVNVKSISGTKKVYFLDLAINLGWQADVQSIVVANNSGTNLTGYAKLGRYENQEVANALIRSVIIDGNSISNTLDITSGLVYVNQKDLGGVYLYALTLTNNSFLSNYDKLEYLLKTAGSLGTVVIGDNNYEGLASDSAVSFEKAPVNYVNKQSRLASEYGYSLGDVGVKKTTSTTDYITLSIPASSIDISGGKGYLFLRSLPMHTRVNAIRMYMPYSVVKAAETDTLTVDYRRSGASDTDEIVSNPISVINMNPIALITPTFQAIFPSTENKGAYLRFISNNSTLLTNMKNSGVVIKVELAIELFN